MKKLLLPLLLLTACAEPTAEEQGPRTTHELAMAIMDAADLSYMECPTHNGQPIGFYDDYICAYTPSGLEETRSAINSFREPNEPWSYEPPTEYGDASYAGGFYLPAPSGEGFGGFITVVIQDDGSVFMAASDQFATAE